MGDGIVIRSRMVSFDWSWIVVSCCLVSWREWGRKFWVSGKGSVVGGRWEKCEVWLGNEVEVVRCSRCGSRWRGKKKKFGGRRKKKLVWGIGIMNEWKGYEFWDMCVVGSKVFWMWMDGWMDGLVIVMVDVVDGWMEIWMGVRLYR